ncbi:hypothetical protein Ae201684P_018413 [Aphanomyces euteiches]|nr:hypothetical protein Ae201684P_018413 [Aphanomyces euteiches]
MEADDDADDDGEPAPDDDTAKPRDEVKPSALRQHVIDITKQWEGSHRVINLDNWYSSVQLCLTLLKMGLYCRGTVRSNRAHNPRFGMFDKKQIKSVMRGSSLVSVATSLGIIAVAWLDGTVVNMISTADATTKSFVHRRIGSQTIQQECLSLVGLYNKSKLQAMVQETWVRSDRHCYHQLVRSVHDLRTGQSTRLASAFPNKAGEPNAIRNGLDITQVPMEYSSVPMTQSTKALKKAAAEDKAAAIQRDASLRQPPTLTNTCRATDKQAEVSYGQRMRRYCVVCYYERSKELIKTQWCDVHQVYLCTKAYLQSEQAVPAHLCPYPEWSRWDKFHSFYQPKGLFKKDGKMDRGNELYKMKKQSEKEHKTSSAKKTLYIT